ncbi:hypothetical protein Tco_1549680 [Tanacetum coccineum]
MGEDFEAFELIGTRTDSSHSSASSDSTIPLSLDHPLTHVLPSPIPTRVSFHCKTARMVVRTQPGTSELILDTDSEGDELEEEDTEKDEEDESDKSQDLKDEGLGLEEEEEVVPEAVKEDQVPNTFKVGQSSRSMPEHEGAPPAAPVQTPPSLEWSLGSLLIASSSPVVPSPVASPVATSTTTISVDEDQFIEHSAMQRKFREMRGRVDALEQERGRKEP